MSVVTLRTGHGRAFGAVTIVNATATGIGCSLAVEAPTEATWNWGGDDFRLESPGIEDTIAKSVWNHARNLLHLEGQGATASVRCPFPPSRGLKTSSSAAGALMRAAGDAANQPLADDVVVALAVQASRDAGVTLTGAFDDQVATVRGGCHLTDNRIGKVLHSLPTPRAHVAVWVPEQAIPKSRVRDVDVSGVRAAATQAVRLVQDGRLAEAMTVNGRAYLAAYAAAGLPVDGTPAEVALAQGALGAGLSGTGPAVAALFAARTELPAVPGGQWTWTKVAP